MEFPAYEGGAGGKFLQRPFRRPSPYDRPPSAVRGLRGLATAAGSGSGWLSKLANPASQFIAGSASRIFSSMFRKGLADLPEAEGSEQNCQVKLYVPEAVDVGPSESQVQNAVDGHNPTKSIETRGISEIEQLLMQKSYTRAQVDYLTGLICSRTIDPTGQESESNNEKDHVSEERVGVRNSSLNRNLSTSETALTIPQDVAASPAEIAKAYMSSRLPKLASSSAKGLPSQEFREKNMPSSGPSAKKRHDLTVVPRTVLRFSEVPELSGSGYPTTKPRGRSAIYRMSRSPYFKVDPLVNVKVSEYTTASDAGPASSQWTPGSTSKYGGRQVLKRDSSFLDGEYGTFGPIRRIRQKSNLISAANARLVSSSSSHSSPLLLDKDDLKNDTSSQKPLSPNELKYASKGLQITENGDGKIFSSNVPPVPGQSSEASRKILEQLNKFEPSLEEKSNRKPIAMDEWPSKLTIDMLNGRALRSMENVDTSQFISMDVIDTSNFRKVKDSQKCKSSQLEKLGKAQENSPLKLDVPGVKFATAANGMSKQAIFNKTSRTSISSADITNTVSSTVLSQRKPAFQMSAPEDLLELDDEQDAVDVSVQSIMCTVKKDSKIAEAEASLSAMSAPEHPLVSSSKNLSVPSSISFTRINRKACDEYHDSEKDDSFRFPVATKSGGLSSPALTPTMPLLSHDNLISQSEQTVVSSYVFGSRSSATPIPSSTTDVANESRIESKPDHSPGKKIQLEGSNLLSGGKNEAEALNKSSGIVSLSGLSASGSTDPITFGASITSTQSNGSVHSSSFSSLLSASTLEAIPSSPASFFPSNSKLTAASSSSPPMSSTLPAFSSTSTFNFGAASTAAPVLVSLSSDKSDSVDTKGTIATKSPFELFNPPTSDVKSAFLSTGNCNTFLMGSSPFTGSGSVPSTEAISSSGMNISTNSTSAMPSIFTGVSSSGTGFAASPSFSTKTNGIFGSNTSAQTNSTSSSAASSISQSSSTTLGAAGGFVFGVQTTQSGSGNSLFSQSSASQPGSFSSSAKVGLSSPSLSVFASSSSVFGLNSSSSPEFGQVPFGTTSQSAKPFGSTSGLSFSSPTTSANSGLPFSSGTCVSSTSSAFPFSSIASASNSSSGLSFSTDSSTSNSGFSFSAGASSRPASNTFSPAVTSGLFGANSLGSTSSISTSLFGSSPSTGFSFGPTALGSSVSSFGFGSSPGPTFSFTSSGATMSAATATPVFGMPNASTGFSAISQNNDQMSVEDTMADDTNQAPASMVPTFGQPNSTPSSNFVFGSAAPAGGTSLFQFGSQHPSTLQNPNPFQAGGNIEFAPGGSFSLGSGGGDKSARKFVKVRRDKARRK